MKIVLVLEFEFLLMAKYKSFLKIRFACNIWFLASQLYMAGAFYSNLTFIPYDM